MAKNRKQKARKAREAKTKGHPWVSLLWFCAVNDAENGKLEELIKVLRADFGRSPKVHAARQWGQARLAGLLEGRNLTRKQGGQQTPMGSLSRGGRRAFAAKIYRDLRAGRAIPTQLLNKLRDEQVERLPKITREEAEQWRRGQRPNTAIGTIATDRPGVVRLKDEVWKPPKLSPAEAIKIAAALMDENEETLHRYVRGETGYGRGRKKK